MPGRTEHASAVTSGTRGQVDWGCACSRTLNTARVSLQRHCGIAHRLGVILLFQLARCSVEQQGPSKVVLLDQVVRLERAWSTNMQDAGCRMPSAGAVVKVPY